MKRFLLAAFLYSVLLSACGSNDSSSGEGTVTPASNTIPSISYSVLATGPHDTSYFTEGLEFYNNTLIESTGLKGKSRLVQTDPKTGKVLQENVMDPKYFGEGCTVLRDTVYQLTYEENTVLLYNVKTFQKIKELKNLRGQGWGLTNDGQHLIASNGSSELFYYRPGTFELVKTLTVTKNGSMINNINELEYVNGFVWANEWMTNNIYKIDLKSGNIVGMIDFSREMNAEKAVNPGAQELNGIAYNSATKRLHLTGKNWSRIYEVQVPL